MPSETGFKKYPHIENSYNQKSIKYYLDLFPELECEQYIIQEKIHGCNIQLIFYPNGKISVGSRTQLISWEDVGALYGIVPFLKAPDKDLAVLMDRFSARAVIDELTINLYGEFFGPGIQKGVTYLAKKRVVFFDIAVNGRLQTPEYLEEFLESMHISRRNLVPSIYEFLGAYSLEVVLRSAEHSMNRNSLLGPSLEEGTNLMEGCVIKPYCSMYVDGNGDPFYLKIKNEAFKEKSRKARPADAIVETPEITELRAMFSAYINETRLQSVFSKLGEINTSNQIGMYIKAFMQDAISDFMKDEEERMKALSKQDQKRVLNFSTIASEMIKSHL